MFTDAHNSYIIHVESFTRSYRFIYLILWSCRSKRRGRKRYCYPHGIWVCSVPCKLRLASHGVATDWQPRFIGTSWDCDGRWVPGLPPYMFWVHARWGKLHHFHVQLKHRITDFRLVSSISRSRQACRMQGLCVLQHVLYFHKNFQQWLSTSEFQRLHTCKDTIKLNFCGPEKVFQGCQAHAL